MVFFATAIFCASEAIADIEDLDEVREVSSDVLEIWSETKYPSAEWIWGLRCGLKGAEPVRNWITKAQDRKRTDVGIGEQILLVAVEHKWGFQGKKKDAIWRIKSGDAYFTTEDSKNDNEDCKEVRGKLAVCLNIKVTGSRAASQEVEVELSTAPLMVNSAGEDSVCGFIARTRKFFTRKCPTGKVKSFHFWQQASEGTDLSGKDIRKERDEGKLVGGWSVIATFPEPVNVNFGGNAQGGVYVMEVDRNKREGTGVALLLPDLFEPKNCLMRDYAHGNKKFIKMHEDGYFLDKIGAGFTTFDISQPLLQNHIMKWRCDWYYKDSKTAKAFNENPVKAIPVRGVAKDDCWKIKFDEIQIFTIFCDNQKWDFQCEKFGSSVRRSREQKTFREPTRIHNWTPWMNTSAPPSPDDNFPGQYKYRPRIFSSSSIY